MERVLRCVEEYIMVVFLGALTLSLSCSSGGGSPSSDDDDQPGQATETVALRIWTIDTDGNPISGATITTGGASGTQTYTSDTSGKITIASMQDGNYSVMAQKQNYQSLLTSLRRP